MSKIVKPYTHLQSPTQGQAQGHVKMAYIIIASLMLIDGVLAESIQRSLFCLCRHTVTLHQGQGHRNDHGIHTSTVMPSLNVMA